MRTAAIALCLAAPACAESVREWDGPKPSRVEIHAPTVPDAVASVTFQNEEVHSADETFALTFDDMTVTVELDWQADDTADERITVYPPPGYIAIPHHLTVPEGETMTLHIFAWEGM